MDGVIIVNKPAGMTSHDVVNRIRKIFKTKKVGHCGTLDPDATGVLVVAVNKATKLLQFLTADNKEYIATLSLGTATDTYDASGQVTATKEYVPISDKKIAILNILAPVLADRENDEILVKAMRFRSDREKAKIILDEYKK